MKDRFSKMTLEIYDNTNTEAWMKEQGVVGIINCPEYEYLDMRFVMDVMRKGNPFTLPAGRWRAKVYQATLGDLILVKTAIMISLNSEDWLQTKHKFKSISFYLI